MDAEAEGHRVADEDDAHRALGLGQLVVTVVVEAGVVGDVGRRRGGRSVRGWWCCDNAVAFDGRDPPGAVARLRGC